MLYYYTTNHTEEHKIEDLLKTNYLLNVVTNYGTLDRIPGSLIHFYSFRGSRLEQHKEKLLKKIKKKIKKLENKLLIVENKFTTEVK